jgi:hypothetical protein
MGEILTITISQYSFDMVIIQKHFNDLLVVI